MVLQAIGFLYRMMLTKLAGTEAMGLNATAPFLFSYLNMPLLSMPAPVVLPKQLAAQAKSI